MLTDAGVVRNQFRHVRLASNVRFLFTLMQKARNQPVVFDANVAWWSKLKASIKVRDRLTHPKKAEDLELSTQEIDDVEAAFAGLTKHLTSYGKVGD